MSKAQIILPAGGDGGIAIPATPLSKVTMRESVRTEGNYIYFDISDLLSSPNDYGLICISFSATPNNLSTKGLVVVDCATCGDNTILGLGRTGTTFTIRSSGSISADKDSDTASGVTLMESAGELRMYAKTTYYGATVSEAKGMLLVIEAQV